MKRIHYKQTGFTIVELLIVIVVIGILAAITVVAYSGVRQRAQVAAHQLEASQAERTIIAHATVRDGNEVTNIGGHLVGYLEGSGRKGLVRPLAGTPDITVYTAYHTLSVATGYPPVAYLAPDTTDHRFRIQGGNTGSSVMSLRADTSAQTNITLSQSGVRVENTIALCWAQASNSATQRAFGCNQATPAGSGPLTPHTSWNFTELLNVDGPTSGSPMLSLAFDSAHNQTTRTQVLNWLAEKYNVTLAP